MVWFLRIPASSSPRGACPAATTYHLHLPACPTAPHPPPHCCSSVFPDYDACCQPCSWLNIDLACAPYLRCAQPAPYCAPALCWLVASSPSPLFAKAGPFLRLLQQPPPTTTYHEQLWKVDAIGASLPRTTTTTYIWRGLHCRWTDLTRYTRLPAATAPCYAYALHYRSALACLRARMPRAHLRISALLLPHATAPYLHALLRALRYTRTLPALPLGLADVPYRTALQCVYILIMLVVVPRCTTYTSACAHTRLHIYLPHTPHTHTHTFTPPHHTPLPHYTHSPTHTFTTPLPPLHAGSPHTHAFGTGPHTAYHTLPYRACPARGAFRAHPRCAPYHTAPRCWTWDMDISGALPRTFGSLLAFCSGTGSLDPNYLHTPPHPTPTHTHTHFPTFFPTLPTQLRHRQFFTPAGYHAFTPCPFPPHILFFMDLGC